MESHLWLTRFLLQVSFLVILLTHQAYGFVQSDSLLFYCDPETQEVNEAAPVFDLAAGRYIMTIDGCQIVENFIGIRGVMNYRVLRMGSETLTIHPHSKLIVMRKDNFIEISALEIVKGDNIILQNGEFLEITSIKNRSYEVSYYIKTDSPYVFIDGIPIQINHSFRTFYKFKEL